MWVETHDHLRRPTRIKASRVVVYDDFDNPIGLFLQTEPHHVIAEIADNAVKFNNTLRQLGIDKTVVINNIVGPPGPLVT